MNGTTTCAKLAMRRMPPKMMKASSTSTQAVAMRRCEPTAPAIPVFTASPSPKICTIALATPFACGPIKKSPQEKVAAMANKIPYQRQPRQRSK